MKAETLDELVNWTRDVHGHLSRCLSRDAAQETDTKARWLLEYLAGHEGALEKIVAGFERQAKANALHTWVYDYTTEKPVETHRLCAKPYVDMSVEEICEDIFSVHNQLIDLYRYLVGRADIPETRELIGQLLALEEQETRRLAQQVNRLGDL